MIKCNVDRCKNNINEQCLLEDIIINFNNYDFCCGYCANFEESEEFKKTTYKLYKLNDTGYLVIRTSVFDSPDLEQIIKEINPTHNITLIFDSLLYVGSATNSGRFFMTQYDIETQDTKDWVQFNADNKLDETLKGIIKKYTCDYIRETGRYGSLSSVAQKMIKGGMNI